jgi:hypothetical protein
VGRLTARRLGREHSEPELHECEANARIFNIVGFLRPSDMEFVADPEPQWLPTTAEGRERMAMSGWAQS